MRFLISVSKMKAAKDAFSHKREMKQIRVLYAYSAKIFIFLLEDKLFKY